MPKRISEKDKKTIYFAYKLGQINLVTYYTDIIEVKCQFSTFKGAKSVNYYGTELQYDAIAVFESNESTQHIDEFTKFWFGTKPVASSAPCDYDVVRIGARSNGLFTVYLRSITQNNDNLWYEIDGAIYETQVKMDKTNLRVVVPSNMYLPIWYTTKVWYEEPTNTNTTDYGIHLVDINKTENYQEFIFESGIVTDNIIERI